MNNLEQEILELQKMIDAKRDQLEKEGGIIEEKELVRQSVQELFRSAQAAPLATPAQTVVSDTPAQAVQNPHEASYLDYLDSETAEFVNQLISEIPQKGITLVINEAAKQEPFVIDAFHDALTDKLYEELRARGLVK